VCIAWSLILIDGEAIVTNGDGLAVFDLIRRKRHGDAAVLIGFDLIELDGEDLRRIPQRKYRSATRNVFFYIMSPSSWNEGGIFYVRKGSYLRGRSVERSAGILTSDLK
jgi:hypothetical protein